MQSGAYASKTAHELCLEFYDAAKNQNEPKIKALLQYALPEVYSHVHDADAMTLLASQKDIPAVEFFLKQGASLAKAAGGFARGGHVKEAFAYLDRAERESTDQYLLGIDYMLIGFARYGEVKQMKVLLARLENEFPERFLPAVQNIGCITACHRSEEETDAFLESIKKIKCSNNRMFEILKFVIMGLAMANRQTKIDLVWGLAETEYKINRGDMYPFLLRGFFQNKYNIEKGFFYLDLVKKNHPLRYEQALCHAVYGALSGGNEKLANDLKRQEKNHNIRKELLSVMINAFAICGHLSKFYEYLGIAKTRYPESYGRMLREAASSLATHYHVDSAKYPVFPGACPYENIKILQGFIYGYANKRLWLNMEFLLSWAKDQYQLVKEKNLGLDEDEKISEESSYERITALLTYQAAGLMEGKHSTEAFRLFDEVKQEYPERTLPMLKTLVKYDQDCDEAIYDEITKTLVFDVEPELREEVLTEMKIPEEEITSLIESAERYTRVMGQRKLTYHQATGWFKPEVWMYLLQCVQLMCLGKGGLTLDAFGIVGAFLVPGTEHELADLADKMSVSKGRSFNLFAHEILKKPSGSTKRKVVEEPACRNGLR